ncbi:hypothetical protein CROQUDRAFT_86527 [Cronartium quercuum f. sp. fusiforme G11]|uniref:Secreted protein n=1 Tax=Cronartium quercuum f. sp. fusiforme G11 TaxID=708437 RepID=A0A9P6NTU4_9BASI|nr:hypothetical protein CROQUDRAFT_86527 [Cronartium quercuum f. sp. fusiforme G11]
MGKMLLQFILVMNSLSDTCLQRYSLKVSETSLGTFVDPAGTCFLGSGYHHYGTAQFDTTCKFLNGIPNYWNR